MTDSEVAPLSFLALDRNGRLLSGKGLDHLRTRLASASPPISDTFVFCSGGIEDAAEARAWAARFFGVLQRSLELLGDRVTPLRIALHWPSKPEAAHAPAELAEWEIALGPEEEAELDALTERRARARGNWAGAVAAWLTKKRAGEVGERFGREYLAPLWADCLPSGRRRLHLIGHSFGARLLTSAVVGGVRPHSLTLLQAPFSAFAFAGEVPGSGLPGFYNRILAARLAGRIVVLRSAHDGALTALYPPLTGASQADHPGRLGRTRQVVATSLMGVAGARGVSAPEVEIREAQRLGFPLQPVVNVDASSLIRAHDDILHPEVATILLMAAALLVGGPDGPRPRPESS
ncbi:MAG: hypothetical protein WAP47_08075 [Candidatus Rokuibacteriota bacterium]